MSGSRDWRDKVYEYVPFIPKNKERRIPVQQRPVVVNQEAANRRRECIRTFYEMSRGARDGDRGIDLPTQEEFDRAVCEGADNGDGEEDPAQRSFMEGIVREVLGEEEIKISYGEELGPKDSEMKDSTSKNDKEEDGDVVKGETMKSAAKVQEADEKGGACPGKADTDVDVKEGSGRILALEHGAGDPGVEGQAGRSLAEGGEARLATMDIECSKNGRDGAENSEMPMDDGKSNAEDSVEVTTVVKPSSAAVACKNGDEGIVENAQVKLEGATSGPRGEEEPVGAEIEAEAEVQEADEKGGACPGKVDAVLNVKEGDGLSLSLEHGAGDPIGVDGQAGRSLADGGEARLVTVDIECNKNGRDGAETLEMPVDDGKSNAEDSDEVKAMVVVEKPSSAAVACKNGDEGIVGNVQVKLEGATSGPGGEEENIGAAIEAEAPVPEAEQEVPAPEAEGQAIAAAAINGQNENEEIPQGQEEFPDFQTAKALNFGEVIRRLRR